MFNNPQPKYRDYIYDKVEIMSKTRTLWMRKSFVHLISLILDQELYGNKPLIKMIFESVTQILEESPPSFQAKVLTTAIPKLLKFVVSSQSLFDKFRQSLVFVKQRSLNHIKAKQLILTNEEVIYQVEQIENITNDHNIVSRMISNVRMEEAKLQFEENNNQGQNSIYNSNNMGGKKNSIVMSSLDRTVQNASNGVISNGKKNKAFSVRSGSKHGSRQQMFMREGRDVSKDKDIVMPGIM